jgi:hypothetical protein
MADKKLDIIADKKLETIALQNKSFKPITGAYPKMVNGKKTKRTTRSRQGADFNDARGFRLPPEKFDNPKKGSRKKAMGGGMIDMTRMKYLKGGQV